MDGETDESQNGRLDELNTGNLFKLKLFGLSWIIPILMNCMHDAFFHF